MSELGAADDAREEPLTDGAQLSEISTDDRVWTLRVSGAVVILASFLYLPWLVRSASPHDIWLSWPFVAANILLVGTVGLSVVNNWERRAGRPVSVQLNSEPLVAVLIPTAGEPVGMVERTIRSVLTQDWPLDKMYIAVGDDAHNAALAGCIEKLSGEFPRAWLSYYIPPARGSDARKGDAKAGNLNAGLAELDRLNVVVAFVETRDADDEVGDRTFLRRCVAQFALDSRVAYVQTIKEAQVSPDDPFGNTDAMFYRGSLLSRHAANAVFPCGSGLVWSRRALEDIEGFPCWNLVEDLQSGVEALRRGWRGVYVPIVGARAQTAPEDIQNVFKQRGTWALDTVRLLVWGNLRGLSLRQRLQFWELGMFYAQSFAVLIFIIAPPIGLCFGQYPLISSQAAYALHFWPMTAAVELYLMALNGKASWTAYFRARQMWIGLAPTYARSVWRAIVVGPYNKPVYKITRKAHQFRWYWRETAPHAILVVGLTGILAYATATRGFLTTLDLGSVYWTVIALVFLASFLSKGWYGLQPKAELAAKIKTSRIVRATSKVRAAAQVTVRGYRRTILIGGLVAVAVTSGTLLVSSVVPQQSIGALRGGDRHGSLTVRYLPKIVRGLPEQLPTPGRPRAALPSHASKSDHNSVGNPTASAALLTLAPVTLLAPLAPGRSPSRQAGPQ